MRKQPHIDELGRDERGVSHDDATGARFELQTEQTPTENTHGLPDHVVDQIIAAVEAEDAVDPNELDQRRYEMERVLIAAEKDRLIAELSDVLNRVFDAVMFVHDNPNQTAITTARLIARNPAVGIDSACLMSARFRRTGSYSTIPTKAEVLAFKS